MHEIDPVYMGLSNAADPQQCADFMRWRRAERQRLIDKRLAIAAETRKALSERITDILEQHIGDVTGLTVSAYWPFRGEPDLRDLLKRIVARGGSTALPVVIEKGRPLIFRAWSPGNPLERGVWNIPIPPETNEVVLPDVLISPVVGFDNRCYRLGYGGGFFDRTLAAMEKTPRIIGVGYEQAMIPTIYPQPHDIPMDVVITENRVCSPVGDPD